MTIEGPLARRVLVIVAILGAGLIFIAIIGPQIGLGADETFILYSWLGLSRRLTALLGTVLVAAAALTAIPVRLPTSANLPATRPVIAGVAARSATALSHVRHYYALGERLPTDPIPGRDFAVLLVLSTALQLVYFAAIPLTFECDATTYYNFARKIVGAGGAYSYVRGPGYPIFLLATGALWPGTFVVTLLLHAIFGILAPVVFYRCLQGLGRAPALTGALVLMASTIPFTAAKLILTEQIYMFVVLVALMYLAWYHDKRDPRAIYAFTAAALFAMFTRWEAQFLVAFGFVAFFILAYRRPRQTRHVVVTAIATVLIVGGYSVARGLIIDHALIGSLQNGTGAQMFWRMMSLSENTIPGRTRHPSPGPAGVAETAKYGQMVRASNGPATMQLQSLVTDFVGKHPESYRALKQPLSQLPEDKDGPAGWIYEEVFGRFDGKPETLANNMFSASYNIATESYVYYITGIAQRELGVAAADRLLREVAIEAVQANPQSLRIMFIELPFQVTGMTIYGIEQVVRKPLNLQAWQDLVYYRDLLTYRATPYDAGGCASSTLPERMMAEYRFDQSLRSPTFANGSVAMASFGRNLIRPAIGIILLFCWWAVFLSPRRTFDLAVMATVGAMIMTAAVLAGVIANYRYEYTIYPLELMLAVTVGTVLIRRLRKNAVSSPG